jgi:hypothetical protein
MKSECYCPRHSCESITTKNPTPINDEDKYIISTGIRFQFIKDDRGVIQDGGMVSPDIPHCRELHKGEWSERPMINREVKDNIPHISNKQRRKMERAKKFGRLI